MKRSSAFLSFNILTLLFTALLPGCRQSEPDQVIHVTRNIGGRAGFRRHFDLWKATFEKRNPGWTMELIDLGNSDGAQYYKSRISTDDLPEVVMTWDFTKMLADGGHLVPLRDDYYRKFGVALPAPYTGKRYTSQGGTQIQGIAVNVKLAREAGITQPPATWDALIADMRKLKAKGIRPLVFGGREWSAAEPLFYAICTTLYYTPPSPGHPSWTTLRDQGKVRFVTDPQMHLIMRRMFELVDGFVEKGALSDGYNEEQRDFYGGKAAIWMMGCWLGGDVESNRVPFDIEYWPVPSMIGKPARFIETSRIPCGWAITTSARGTKLEKAMAVMETFYDRDVYQALLDGESQFGEAAKVDARKPQSVWPPAQRLFDNMETNMRRYGTTCGEHLALDDIPPNSFIQAEAAVMQEIIAGTRDENKLLKMLDDAWDEARKGD